MSEKISISLGSGLYPLRYSGYFFKNVNNNHYSLTMGLTATG